MIRRFRLAAPLLLVASLWSSHAAANVNVCIDVQVKSWALTQSVPPAKPAGPPAVLKEERTRTAPPGTEPAPAPAPPAPAFDPLRDFYASEPAPSPAAAAQAGPPAAVARDPHRLDPASYLRRLLEYEVTHAEGFVAVPKDCRARIVVELYTLAEGWTVFARFTQNGREEKVDRVLLDEFEALAQRIAYSLLGNRPIADTINRENVLRSDSAQAARTMRGRGHAALAMGTSVRVGELPTAQGPDAPVENQVRWLTPFEVQLGYRLKLKSWGLDAFTRATFGSEDTALRSNQLGGHVDYAGSGSLGLHFLRYLNSSGVNSLYVGGGASLEVSLFDVIRAQTQRDDSDRSWLVGGGLNVDLLLGYEFLRASAVHFFAELELVVPTYAFKTENSAGSIETYLPGGLIQFGVIL